MNSPYINLVRFHNRNVYTKGANKGDAPLDRRRATHKRVLAPTDTEVRVRMHCTNILVAHVDGTITLDTDGWHMSPTTRETMRTAMREAGLCCWMLSKRVGGYSQTAISTAKGTWRFYDGMKFDAEGRLLSEVKPWTAKVADRAARKARLAKLKPLLDVLPILHDGLANMDPKDRPYPLHVSRFREDQPELWPAIVWEYMMTTYVDGTWRDCAKQLKAAAVEPLTMLVDREVA